MPESLRYFTTYGMSMWPIIRSGERLCVRGIPYEQLRQGDIIIYEQQGVVMCHRIIGSISGPEGKQYKCAGDTTIDAPTIISSTDYRGAVIAKIRRNTIIPLRTKRARFCSLMRIFYAPFFTKFFRMWFKS